MDKIKTGTKAFLTKFGRKSDDLPTKGPFIHIDDRDVFDSRQIQSLPRDYKMINSFHTNHSDLEEVNEVELLTPTSSDKVVGAEAVEMVAATPDATPFSGSAPMLGGFGMPYAEPMPQAPSVMPMPMVAVLMPPPLAQPMPVLWPQDPHSAAAPMCEADLTTLAFRNIPCNYTRQDILHLLDEQNVSYDFVYLPIDFKRKANLGYAFVNVVSPVEAERVWQCLSGFSDWRRSTSVKRLDVRWAEPDQQGLAANISRYQDSPIMHEAVPDEWKPALFFNGQRQMFPAPTRRLRRPDALNR